VAGKEEWLAYGLPTEGDRSGIPKAGDLAHEDVVSCGLGDPVGPVREKARQSGYGFALVVSTTGVLLGRLGRAALEGDPDATAEQAMEAGPWTVRPHIELAPLVERLRGRDLKFAIVTTPDGVLVGVVRCAEAEAHLAP
jgi:CBS domain containing-hemolysin-like protein